MDSKRFCPAGTSYEYSIKPRVWYSFLSATLNPHTWARTECTHARSRTHTHTQPCWSGWTVFRCTAAGDGSAWKYLQLNDCQYGWLGGRWNQPLPSPSLPVSKRFSGGICTPKNRRATILCKLSCATPAGSEWDQQVHAVVFYLRANPLQSCGSRSNVRGVIFLFSTFQLKKPCGSRSNCNNELDLFRCNNASVISVLDVNTTICCFFYH